MPNWTDAQLDAIKARRGTVLVSAAAGSGKTAVLVERVIERLTDPEHPTDADRLLVVTFTKAAAAEMRDRMTGSFGYNFSGKPSHFCPNCGRPVPEGYRCACTDTQQAPTVEVTAEPAEEPSASAVDNKPQE